jgi:hypothetical protein
MAVKTYNPKKIELSFLGVPISGFADGTFVRVEYNEDQFTLMVGADGEAARAQSANKSGRITCTLMQTSLSNDVFAAAAAADQRSGLSIGPAFIKDSNGRMRASASEAWVVKHGAPEFGKEVGSREWIIECADLDLFAGGN